MQKTFFSLFLILFINSIVQATTPYSVKGLCLSAPPVDLVDEFVDFIETDLGPTGLNLLILRIDWNYNYKSNPKLRGNNPLKKQDVKKIVNACKKNNIRLIPQINLLGHQSWHGHINKLLEVYPEFDETPDIELPEKYEWPNDDGLYCKSYCPLHPEVHKIIFPIIDEIVDVFESDAFHAGLDEVFYIGHKQCPRCFGHDKAELFAGEVTLLRNHLSERGKELWMWGDRLIDGKTTGIGIWEGSFNNTHRAIDLIPKDVIICDWHYDRPIPTAVLFAAKGFSVLTCPWRKPDVTEQQEKMICSFINSSPDKMKNRYMGMLQTVWSSTKSFMDSYKNIDHSKSDNSSESFKVLVKSWK